MWFEKILDVQIRNLPLISSENVKFENVTALMIHCLPVQSGASVQDPSLTKKNKKNDPGAQILAEQIRRNGVAVVPIRMAEFYAGEHMRPSSWILGPNGDFIRPFPLSLILEK